MVSCLIELRQCNVQRVSIGGQRVDEFVSHRQRLADSRRLGADNGLMYEKYYEFGLENSRNMRMKGTDNNCSDTFQ